MHYLPDRSTLLRPLPHRRGITDVPWVLLCLQSVFRGKPSVVWVQRLMRCRGWFSERQNLCHSCYSRVGVFGCSTVLCLKPRNVPKGGTFKSGWVYSVKSLFRASKSLIFNSPRLVTHPFLSVACQLQLLVAGVLVVSHAGVLQGSRFVKISLKRKTYF